MVKVFIFETTMFDFVRCVHLGFRNYDEYERGLLQKKHYLVLIYSTILIRISSAMCRAVVMVCRSSNNSPLSPAW